MSTHCRLDRLSCFLLLCLCATPIQAIAFTGNATLTVGRVTAGCATPGVNFTLSGYLPSQPIGACSPTGLAGGTVVGSISEVTGLCAVNGSFLTVSGFSSSPGSSWLTSITCNGVIKSMSSSSYTYSGGGATWSWATSFGLWAKPVASNVLCTIVLN